MSSESEVDPQAIYCILDIDNSGGLARLRTYAILVPNADVVMTTATPFENADQVSPLSAHQGSLPLQNSSSRSTNQCPFSHAMNELKDRLASNFM